MIYHILGTSIYNNRFIQTLIKHQKECNLPNHCFLFFESDKNKLFDPKVLDQVSYRVFKHQFSINFLIILLKLKRRDKIIVHGLFYPYIILIGFFFPGLLKKVIWSIWGYDLYFYKYSHNSLKHRILEYFRRKTIPRFGAYVCNIKGEYEILAEVYQSKRPYIYAIYPTTVLFDSKLIVQDKTTRILVGNSAHKTNNHSDILRTLSRFNMEDIEIIVPLSYGDSVNYIKEVCSTGEYYFKEKFIPLLGFMGPSDYSDLLQKIDIVVYNHDLQEGLGSLLPLINLKKKVYIKKQVTTYSYLVDLGVDLYDTNIISQQNFEEFKYFLNTKGEKNSEIIKKEISDENIISSWNNVFNYEIV